MEINSNEKFNIKLLDRQKDQKIKFLQEQNQALRDEIKDLEENLRVNKESIALLTKKIPSSSHSRKIPSIYLLPNEHLNNDETTDTIQINSLQKVIENLMQENQRHLENIRKLINDRNNAQAKV